MWTRRAKKVKKVDRRDERRNDDNNDAIDRLEQKWWIRSWLLTFTRTVLVYMNIIYCTSSTWILKEEKSTSTYRLDDRDNSDANVGVNDDLKGASKN